MTAGFTARSVARTHVGAIRVVNEDRLFNAANDGLWAIADGMGGHANGDVAAEITVGALARLVGQALPICLGSIAGALDEANGLVLDLTPDRHRKSGSTVAGLLIDGTDAVVFWAGDSRVYRSRDGRLDLLTHDHRVVQDLIDAGTLSPEQARRHPNASVISRAVGGGPTLDLASCTDAARAGDIYLLCSDGLSDLVDPEAIATIIGEDDGVAADALVALALATGGTDNISLIIVSLDAVSRAR